MAAPDLPRSMPEITGGRSALPQRNGASPLPERGL